MTSLLLQIDFLRSLVQPFTSGQYSLLAVAVELLLIGAPVYLILRFLRGTRGERLVWAVGLILGVSFLLVRLVAQKFGLDRINFLYPYFVLAILAVALVVFQTELRRGLIRIGERGWFRAWSKSAKRAIDPVVTAAARLSKKKIGALIAIERSTSLGGVAETGIQIDAVVSAELLESVFWPGSALHDMAAIVADGRLVAARCQFPLADTGELDGSLGSRHRAAVGMSQECDAVVVVVSEETGTISVAERGRLRRSLTPDSLHDLLISAFSEKPAAKRLPRKPAPKPGIDSTAAPAPAPKPPSGATGELVETQTKSA